MFFPLFSGRRASCVAAAAAAPADMADEQSFFGGQLAAGADRIVVAYGDYFIHYASIVNFGDESGPDALYFVRAGLSAGEYR